MEIDSKSYESKQSRKQASHERILTVAARAVGLNGCAGVGIADVMRQAGLTHGGFYAHFESRQSMLAEAIEHAGKVGAEALARGIAIRRAHGASLFCALVETYLSEKHMASPEHGCPIAALGAEVPRQETGLGDVSRRQVELLVEAVKQALPPGTAPGSEVVVASTLVGALQMARILKGANGSELLSMTRKTLIQQYDVSIE